MEIALFEAILKALAEIRIFKISKRKDKERIFNAVEAIQQAANKTKHYYATMSTTENAEPNLDLSDAWVNAASAVRDLDSNLYMRLLSKAEYWANPKQWTPEMSEQKNIYLDEILEDSNRILRKEIKEK